MNMVLKIRKYILYGLIIVIICTLLISISDEPPDLANSYRKNICIECDKDNEVAQEPNYFVSYFLNTSDNKAENKSIDKKYKYIKNYKEDIKLKSNVTKSEIKPSIPSSNLGDLGQYRTEVIKVVTSSSVEERQLEYKRRLAVVADVCSRYNVKTNQGAMQHLFGRLVGGITGKGSYLEHVNPDNFYIAHPSSTMACVINKVASTSLVMGLLDASGLPRPTMESNSPHAISGLLRPKTDAEFDKARKSYFTFMMVRHPFERLLSAYRDKVEQAEHWSLLNLRSHILATKHVLRDIKRKRQQQEINNHNIWGSEEHSKTIENNSTESYLPFLDQNFVNDRETEYNRLTSNKRKHFDKYSNKTVEVMRSDEINNILNISSEYLNETVPSFSDFLEYILTTNLEGGGFDAHWVPYWKRCTPCSVKYDVVAKLETGDGDFQYIWRKTFGARSSGVPWQNRSGATGSSDVNLLRKYYKTLEKDLIKRVHQRFMLDFELFEYDIRTVYQLAGHCQSIMECDEIM